MKISVETLGKRFNREWIFKNLTHTFEGGTPYAIVGPNGSGKSTLLQVLWGQMPASVGTLSYTLQQKKIALEDAYQYLAIAAPYMDLIEEFTALEMIDFHFKFKKPREGKTSKEVLDCLELSHASNKRLSNFSSGMRQRIKLGLAFYSDVTTFFLDEPCTNLDKKSVAWYHNEFSKLPKTSLIFIASNQEDEYPPSSKKIDISDFK
jgi:ABC-type multidrug transport system ATPase subunit